MSFQVDSIVHNINLQSVVPRQVLTIKKNDNLCSRPKPAPSANDRCCPSVLGRLPPPNRRYIHSALETEWNSGIVKSTLNSCKQQWCRSLLHGNVKASCIQHRLLKASCYLTTHLRTTAIGHNPQPCWPQEEESTDQDPSFLWLAKWGCSFIFFQQKKHKKIHLSLQF